MIEENEKQAMSGVESTTQVKNTYRRFDQVKAAIQGVEAIDYFFAKEMDKALISVNHVLLQKEQQDNLYHLFLALSASLRAGHSCLSLTEIAGTHWGKGYPVVKSAIVTESEPKNGLEQTDSTQTNHDNPEDPNFSHTGFNFSNLQDLHEVLASLNIKADDQQLLVYENDQLYLRRYYQFEQDLGKSITNRLIQACLYSNENIEQCIATLFPTSHSDEQHLPNEVDWQKIAVANAINKNFSVIAGGPGTGKTYTVTKLLAALVMLSQHHKPDSNTFEKTLPENNVNIALVAPTGKAAQRLSESIVDAIAGFTDLIDDHILAKIPSKAQTIHRLLGVIPNSPNFKHNEKNKLAYDIVLIDEVSMVDLPLMTRIFRALKDSAKVILLGDADQLPSVAAGSVLADIAPRPHGGYSDKNKAYLTQTCHLSAEQVIGFEKILSSSTIKASLSHPDYLSFLVKSRRFDGKGGIGLIANEVINGEAKPSWQRLINTRSYVSDQLTIADGDLVNWLKPLVKQYYQPISDCTEVSHAFTLLAQFRVLCATRQGDYGVEHINELIKSYLGKSKSLFQQNQSQLYHGLPIMINENDYRLGLYNGDVGIIWRIEDQQGNLHLMACFESDDENQVIRKVLPSRLPKFESVYAMTIHKTQGSEFSHVAMLLSASDTDLSATPQRGSKLLTRELLYTGITRAKKQLTVCANQQVWQQGVLGQVKRNSGLVISGLVI